MRAFDFFQLLNTNMFNGTLNIRFFIDISWRCLKTVIADIENSIGLINSDNLVTFKFRNSAFDLKDNN